MQVKHLRDKSGFGWDEGLARVTATDEVWDALIAVRLLLHLKFDLTTSI